MATNFKTLEKECYETGNYEEYVKQAKQQYFDTKNENDLLELQKAEKYLTLYHEIQQIIELENRSSYEILEITQTSTITEIKRVFRQMASKYHPDRAPVKGSHDAFRIIQKAYFDINTEEKKADYDSNRLSKPFQSARASSNIYGSHTQTGQTFVTPGGIFSFSTSFSTSNRPIEFYYQDLATSYSSLFGSRFQNQQRDADQRPTLGIVFIIIVFLIINALA